MVWSKLVNSGVISKSDKEWGLSYQVVVTNKTIHAFNRGKGWFTKGYACPPEPKDSPKNKEQVAEYLGWMIERAHMAQHIRNWCVTIGADEAAIKAAIKAMDNERIEL